MQRTTLIIPCYQEAERLDTAALATLLADGVDLRLVDDGSTDATGEILTAFAAAHAPRVRLLTLAQNSGKAEAVRQGLLAELEGSTWVGYLDADLATPPEEMLRLVDIMRGGDAQVLFGARVAVLGHSIERSAARHYLGRIFATLASLSLGVGTYDTQCGAKLFRVSPSLAAALAEPFLSRWAFDVELLGRLLTGSRRAPAVPVQAVIEEPLRVWRDVRGSKLRATHMSRALVDLIRIDRDLRRRRSQRS